jgi:hypothetical protein
VVASATDLGWVMRKNNPQFKQLVDEFAATHVAGTSFGNTLLRRLPAEHKVDQECHVTGRDREVC